MPPEVETSPRLFRHKKPIENARKLYWTVFPIKCNNFAIRRRRRCWNNFSFVTDPAWPHSIEFWPYQLTYAIESTWNKILTEIGFESSFNSTFLIQIFHPIPNCLGQTIKLDPDSMNSFKIHQKISWIQTKMSKIRCCLSKWSKKIFFLIDFNNFFIF